VFGVGTVSLLPQIPVATLVALAATGDLSDIGMLEQLAAQYSPE
jgi:hypothetical protein